MQKTELLKFIKKLKSLKILVFGDFMLDHYIFGAVERISPEAPIPILLATEEQFQLGGAGCCVSSLLNLNCYPIALGVYGQDTAGNKLASILKDKKIIAENLLQVEDYQTIVKCRLLSNKQQLFRIDYEKKFAMNKSISNKLLKKLTNLADYKGLIISDYFKGNCSPYILKNIINQAKKSNLFTMVDPAKGRDFTVYKGANCIKPNRLEAEIFCQTKLNNLSDYIKAAAFIQNKTKVDLVVLSLDKEGLFLYQNKHNHQLFKTNPESVYDVTGAGDLVTTVITVVLASGGTTEQAAVLANLAAAINIKKLGGYNPTWQEIKAQVGL